MEIIKSLNIGLAFLLELAMLIAFGYWGFQTGDSTLVKILLGIGVPVVVIVIWGMYLAPRSTRRLRDPWLSLLKLVLFGAAALALVAANQPTWGLILAIIALVNILLAWVWKQAG
jgi:hypothetical protein